MNVSSKHIREWVSRQMVWIKDYLREISIIIISLCITYYGDSIMDAYAEKIDDEDTMRMLYDELSANIAEYGEMKEYYENDILLSDKYRQYKQSGTIADKDSVNKLNGQHRFFRFWTLKVNAFKIASQSATIKRVDKKLLMKIYESYEYLQVADDMGATYRNKRFDAIVGFVNANAGADDAYSIKRQWQQISGDADFEDYILVVMPALAKSTLSICLYSMQTAIETQKAILSEYPEIKEE